MDISNKNPDKIPDNQNSVCGGFFIAKKEKVEWWSTYFEARLKFYIANNKLVKDDQILILDSILRQRDKFNIIVNSNWFHFIDFLT